MGAKPLINEITQYLGRLNEQQPKAALGVVKTFAKDQDGWDDKGFIAEMDKRFAELETGKVKEITLDELQVGARHANKTRKSKKA